MESHSYLTGKDEKPGYQPLNQICRCCLATTGRMCNVKPFEAYFGNLAGINVMESDGLPQWICVECCQLLRKAVRFKQKMLRAQTVLYEYLTRCAPFPLDAQDPELCKYRSSYLCATDILYFDNFGKNRSGNYQVLEHKKCSPPTELDIPEVPLLPAKEERRSIKEEEEFSDYDDNVTLDTYKGVSEELENLFRVVNSAIQPKEEDKIKKKKKIKNREDKIKKKLKKPTTIDGIPKKSIRRKKVCNEQMELDPEKIRIVNLNPEEQIKQQEEDSKFNLNFPFFCQLCFKGFNFEAKLQNHMSKHSPSRGPYKCSVCHMHLPTAYSHSVHMLIHTRRYQCCECGRTMIDKASILHHYRTQHEGQVTVFTCHICGKVSNNNKTHRGHMRNIHSTERPRCDQCNKSFVNKDSLIEHLQIHQGIKNYECPTCGKRFRTRTQIKQHQLMHVDAKEFYCVECDTRFKTAHSLRQHLMKSLKHTDKSIFKNVCSICEKRYETPSLLAKHTRIQHEGIRPYRCTICLASLATKASLRKHERAHTGAVPRATHVCHTCGKSFSGRSVLINHVRTHTGERPYECDTCGRRFTQASALRTHVKLIHLKIKRNIKPSLPKTSPESLSYRGVTKEEPLGYEAAAWGRQPSVAISDVFFTVTAGP